MGTRVKKVWRLDQKKPRKVNAQHSGYMKFLDYTLRTNREVLPGDAVRAAADLHFDDRCPELVKRNVWRCRCTPVRRGTLGTVLRKPADHRGLIVQFYDNGQHPFEVDCAIDEVHVAMKLVRGRRVTDEA